MNLLAEMNIPCFSKAVFSDFILRELRSDHAGETGAVFIYKGVLAVARDPVVRIFAEDHLVTENQHLDFFNQWLPNNYHSKLLFLWKLSGFFLGAFSALMGKKILFLTITAVETFVVKHYAKQISYLHSQGSSLEKSLIPILVKFQSEEQYHCADAESRLGHAGSVAKLWCSLVGLGSSLAVTVAKRV
ncbi:MAG: ubiquinone biosynthesis monooxygenase Coq7 [Cellvibrionaceae bacterium]|jgi:ubiquinone biosynthesis monooxygenase Coq7